MTNMSRHCCRTLMFIRNVLFQFCNSHQHELDFSNASQTELHVVLLMFPILNHSNKHETLWTSSTWSQVTILRGKTTP